MSEDVLKDGKKFYESGLPVDGDPSQYSETVWGRVPTQNSVTYAFNTASGSRQNQDVGFNGLTSEQERSYPAYADISQRFRLLSTPMPFKIFTTLPRPTSIIISAARTTTSGSCLASTDPNI